MSAAALTISVIAILIALAIAWKEFGGREDSAALRDWWRRRRSRG